MPVPYFLQRLLRQAPRTEVWATCVIFLILVGVIALGYCLGRTIGHRNGTDRLAATNAELRQQLYAAEGRAWTCEDRYAGAVTIWSAAIEQDFGDGDAAGGDFQSCEDDWYRLSIYARGNRSRALRFMRCWKDVSERCGLIEPARDSGAVIHNRALYSSPIP